MKIGIATVQVPFILGGAEVHSVNLRNALLAHGHEAELIQIPFKWYPPEKILDHMLACRLLDLTESNGQKIDLLIGLRFPAYLIEHPCKVLWILHQYRAAYELWQHEIGDLHLHDNGQEVRDAIITADRNLIPQAKAIYTNSQNVSKRLRHYCDIPSTPLYHPPNDADKFQCSEAEDYLYYPSRIDPMKRHELLIRALAECSSGVRLIFSGRGQPQYEQELQQLAARLGVAEKINWTGFVSEEEKRDYYSRSLGVLNVPFDEDYGYITLEGFLSSKPVLTCTDSGGVLEFVEHGVSGLISEPEPAPLAAAMDQLFNDRPKSCKMGENGLEIYEARNISWDNVVQTLTSHAA